jgi:hypothetical protein
MSTVMGKILMRSQNKYCRFTLFFPDRSQNDSSIFQSGQPASTKVFNQIPNNPQLSNQVPSNLLFNNQRPNRSRLSSHLPSKLVHSNPYSPFHSSLYLSSPLSTPSKD